ncbi:hypothetical protein G7Y89_g13890 [Cudoniella acicularis]|uniref:Beta-lactamase-related domain-containing protein n=1 Tax=Cudoniella acicularis TaxID=354080 RepID=A0A8H4VVM5_9HELO|nr:hypothetical protein G7Y89_g13890 [Cudoniella acicularis]
MASETFEERVERACKNREIPGTILVGEDKEGKLRYEKVFGRRSLKDLSKPDPLTLDATMWLASCTKLPTTVAVMQCVEKGLLKLEDDITGILPEFKDVKILTGFDESNNVFLLETNQLSRHLLTHLSGLSYAVFMMARYGAQIIGEPTLNVQRSLTEEFKFPLLFAPGEAWEYGVGIDWAGAMVERVTGTTLEEYVNENTWGGLGVKSMTFHPKRNPAVFEKLTDMSLRGGGINEMGTAIDLEGIVEYTDDRVWNLETPDSQGGAGSFGSPLDYQKLLHSICKDDEKILKKTTVDLMFQDHLTPEAKKAFNQMLEISELNEAYGGIPRGIEVTYGLGGMISLNDNPGGRRAGTMNWGGYPNLLWFIDRKGGMSGIIGSQICPLGDVNNNSLFRMWE